MRAYPFPEFVARMEHEVQNVECETVNHFFNSTHLRDAELCWHHIDECWSCSRDFAEDETVFFDEAGGRVFCFRCLDASEQS